MPPAPKAQAVVICVDDREATNRIVELLQHHFPHVQVLARSFDRRHALELVARQVHAQVRETFESALQLGEKTLLAIGVETEDAAEVVDHIRQRDRERFELEVAGGAAAGVERLYGNLVRTAPLTRPQRTSQALNEEAKEVMRRDDNVIPTNTTD